MCSPKLYIRELQIIVRAANKNQKKERKKLLIYYEIFFEEIFAK